MIPALLVITRLFDTIQNPSNLYSLVLAVILVLTVVAVTTGAMSLIIYITDYLIRNLFRLSYAQIPGFETLNVQHAGNLSLI